MSKISNLFEANRQEIATAVYEDLLTLAENIQFGTIGVNFTLHNGIIQRVEFTETRKSRIAAGGTL